MTDDEATRHIIERDNVDIYKLFLQKTNRYTKKSGWHPPQVWRNKSDHDNELMFYAVEFGAVKCLDLMLTYLPMNPNSTNSDGHTPFCHAVRLEEFDCAKVGFIL